MLAFLKLSLYPSLSLRYVRACRVRSRGKPLTIKLFGQRGGGGGGISVTVVRILRKELYDPIKE